MPTFQITGPDGKQYRVTGDTAEGAVQALQTSRLDQLGTALQNADAAGDTQAAQTLAQAYRQEQATGGGSTITPDMARQELARREFARRQEARAGTSSGQPTPLANFRSQYPQYGDMDDATLAGALHQKFYADMPRAEFDAKVGTPPSQVAGGTSAGMTIEQERALALARARRRRAEADRPPRDLLAGTNAPRVPRDLLASEGRANLPPLPPGFAPDPPASFVLDQPSDDGSWWKNSPIVQDANGQRYDESGVPVGGRPLPVQRVEVPGMGLVEFPGGMSNDEMSKAIRHASRNQPELFSADAPEDRWWESSPIVEPKFGGAAMNTTAGANEALYGVLGAPVDIMTAGMNLGIRGLNAATGSNLETINDPFGGSRSIARGMGSLAPELDPANTVAASTGDRIARGVGQGVAGAVLPAGLVGGASRAGLIGTRGTEMGTAAFGRAGSVTDATLGAAGGAGSAIGQEVAPEGYGGLGSMAGGMIGSTAAMGGILGLGLGRAAVAPFTAGGRDRLAGQRLEQAATDPQTLRRALDRQPDPLVPGSRPTTFQATGDLGIGAMERGAANRAPDQFAQRRADQNAARTSALGRIETGGAPERVAASVRQRLADIEAEGDRMVEAAMSEARNRTSAIGSPMAPEVAGGNMRSAIEAARASAKGRERALWSAVDPDGTMTLGLQNTRKSAHDLAEDMSPLAAPMTDTERQIYTAIGQAGEVVPLRAMQDLQANLKAALRSERMANGESPSYRRMSLVAAGIAKDFDDAVAGKVAQEARAVASGRMSAADTVEARWAREIEVWREGRQAAAGGDRSSSPVGYAGGPTPSVPRPYGTEGQAFGQSGGPAGGAGLPGDAGGGSFDRAARERLNAANAATRDRALTFDNGTLGPIRQRPATTAPYTMPAGVVPAQVFNASPKSFEAINQLRGAIGDQQATEALQGYATGEVLRVAGRPDGTIDPAKLATWRRSHANALRALPELDARLADAGRASSAIADVAAARLTATENARKGALGRLVGVDAPEDVTRIVGGIFSAQDAAQRMRTIRQAVGTDPEAARGLRRAVVEHISTKFIGNTEAGTSGLGTMKSDAFQTFVRQNGAALEAAGFSSDELRTLGAIAEDLQRANRSLASVKNPGGSDTAQNLYQLGKDGSPFSAAVRTILAPGGIGLGVGVTSGSTTGIAAGAAAAAFSAMRSAGLRTVDDIVTDALLNPERARLLLSKVKPGEEGSRWEALARSYGQSAVRALSQEEPVGAPERRAEASPQMNAIARALQASASKQAPVPASTMAVAKALLATGAQAESRPRRDPKHDAIVKALLERSAA